MCGICGKLIYRETTPAPELIRSMCETIAHRGPDDEGVYTAPHIGLGQRRLSIIDLRPTAAPPLPNEDDSVWVVFNGEIYNFQSLREDLLDRGHRFRTNSDTEVIVHLYEEYGTRCLDHLRGMFAFALWDAGKKRLFAARDRLGMKPFCYARHPRGLVFGSEIKAIVADPDISVAPDFRAIDLYMSYLAVPSPFTAFDGISRLPAGHFLTSDVTGEFRVEAYWRPPLVADKMDAPEEALQEELLHRLREAVRLRMVSDVPLGAFLSGGIDSTAIVALMAQESSHPIKTFSIGFKEEKYNELPYARLLAERYGTDHHEFIVEPDLKEALPLLVRHYNEPFADPSAIPTYYVSKMARQHVTVALSGDGGDESFSGYTRYGTMLNWERFNALPGPLRRALARLGSIATNGIPNRNTASRIDRGFAMLGGDLRERYLLQMAHVKPSEKALLYTKRFRSILHDRQDVQDPVSLCAYDQTMDALSWLTQHDQMHNLPDCLMVKSDIASMANSLELRCPLLDHRVVEFAAGIPSGYKRDGKGGKQIFKKTVAHLLPSEILGKHKTGFDMPVGEWFRGELSDILRECLLSDRIRRRGLLDVEHLNRMIQEHTNGTRLWTNRLWICLMLELWFREFID